MRKLFLQLIFVVSVAMLATASVASASGELIRSFDVEARINPDASVDITETIRYDFGSEERRGIYRDIPVRYDATYGNQLLRISDIKVVDESGAPYEFDVSDQGKYKRIKIGDPDVYVTGVKTYVITYVAKRAIGFFEDHDELYWNATGNEWGVPIDSATATVTAPWKLETDSVTASCYYGPFGSTETCMTEVLPSGEAATVATFRASYPLGSREGLTIAFGFPKGRLHEPTWWERALYVIRDNLVLLLPVIVLIYMMREWRRKGKDPKGKGVIVPEYDAPDGLSPMEVSALMHQGMKASAVSAGLIELAVKGWLAIKKTEEKHLIGKTDDYVFERRESGKDVEGPEKKLFDSLFAGERSAPEVKMSSLKNKFYKDVREISKAAIGSVVEKGYYPATPEKMRRPYLFALAGFFALLWIVVAVGLGSGPAVVAIIVSGGIVGIFSIFMPKVTPKGALAKERVLGLKEYLSIAEKDRLKFHNAPEKRPELFEKLLPFAMVLGVEEAWAKEFEGLLTTPPRWYIGPPGTSFNSVAFAHDMHSFGSTVTSTMASAPGSSSGAGGGGFSGGGGGGGGGGSW